MAPPEGAPKEKEKRTRGRPRREMTPEEKEKHEKEKREKAAKSMRDLRQRQKEEAEKQTAEREAKEKEEREKEERRQDEKRQEEARKKVAAEKKKEEERQKGVFATARRREGEKERLSEEERAEKRKKEEKERLANEARQRGAVEREERLKAARRAEGMPATPQKVGEKAGKEARTPVPLEEQPLGGALWRGLAASSPRGGAGEPAEPPEQAGGDGGEQKEKVGPEKEDRSGGRALWADATEDGEEEEEVDLSELGGAASDRPSGAGGDSSPEEVEEGGEEGEEEEHEAEEEEGQGEEESNDEPYEDDYDPEDPMNGADKYDLFDIGTPPRGGGVHLSDIKTMLDGALAEHTKSTMDGMKDVESALEKKQEEAYAKIVKHTTEAVQKVRDECTLKLRGMERRLEEKWETKFAEAAKEMNEKVAKKLEKRTEGEGEKNEKAEKGLEEANKQLDGLRKKVEDLSAKSAAGGAPRGGGGEGGRGGGGGPPADPEKERCSRQIIFINWQGAAPGARHEKIEELFKKLKEKERELKERGPVRTFTPTKGEEFAGVTISEFDDAGARVLFLKKLQSHGLTIKHGGKTIIVEGAKTRLERSRDANFRATVKRIGEKIAEEGLNKDDMERHWKTKGEKEAFSIYIKGKIAIREENGTLAAQKGFERFRGLIGSQR